MRTIKEIAQEISKEWKNINPNASAYLMPMHRIIKISDKYGEDDGKTIVLYFLANATYWRGEAAKRIKAELKSLVNS
jgi:hypothetical protein